MQMKCCIFFWIARVIFDVKCFFEIRSVVLNHEIEKGFIQLFQKPDAVRFCLPLFQHFRPNFCNSLFVICFRQGAQRLIIVNEIVSELVISIWPETRVFRRAAGRGWQRQAVARLKWPAVTRPTSIFSGDNDTAPVGLGGWLCDGRLQAASAKVSRQLRFRRSNSRPMTCRL
jgi:hypothetical protein